MIRLPGIDNRIREAPMHRARCPFCGETGAMPAFRAVTGLYYMSIRLTTIHDRNLLLCPACHKAFWEKS